MNSEKEETMHKKQVMRLVGQGLNTRQARRKLEQEAKREERRDRRRKVRRGKDERNQSR